MAIGVNLTQFEPDAVRIIETGGAGIRLVTNSAEGFLHLNIQFIASNMPDEMVICKMLAFPEVTIWCNANAIVVVGHTTVGLYQSTQLAGLVEAIII